MKRAAKISGYLLGFGIGFSIGLIATIMSTQIESAEIWDHDV